MRVYIDGVRVLNKWVNQAAKTYTFTRNMTAGYHNIKVEYYESAGQAVAKLSWLQ
jgi:hypothetical protein